MQNVETQNTLNKQSTKSVNCGLVDDANVKFLVFVNWGASDDIIANRNKQWKVRQKDLLEAALGRRSDKVNLIEVVGV